MKICICYVVLANLNFFGGINFFAVVTPLHGINRHISFRTSFNRCVWLRRWVLRVLTFWLIFFPRTLRIWVCSGCPRVARFLAHSSLWVGICSGCPLVARFLAYRTLRIWICSGRAWVTWFLTRLSLWIRV